MAGICYRVMSDNDSNAAGCKTAVSRATRRRRMEIKRFEFVSPSESDVDNENLRPTKKAVDFVARDGGHAIENEFTKDESRRSEKKETSPTLNLTLENAVRILQKCEKHPRFGMASVCGRRRDMEDAVAIWPSFFCSTDELVGDLHYFAVYDGHGCSHVALRCSERLHQLVREELGKDDEELDWRKAMERSFSRMDEEVSACNQTQDGPKCRCELQSPECDAVGSTAVVAIVALNKIIVANCGDSRAVLCRNGKAIPLSSDHKPDRPDELNRIQEAGGRVIYWDGPRVLGVLAMSRAIGDNYLKPYVSCVPEVMIMDRTSEDDCLILGTDGLWDVVSNDTACGVARMCLRRKLRAPRDVDGVAVVSGSASSSSSHPVVDKLRKVEETADKACSDASLLLTKLALARRSSDNVSIVVVDLSRRDT